MISAAYLDHWKQRIDLPEGETTLGRDPACEIQVQDDAVSRRHLRFVVRNDSVWVEDLSSTNGTVINGRPLVGGQTLLDGDVLQLGHALFIVCIEHATAAAQADPPLAELARAFVEPSGAERRIHPRIPASVPVRFGVGDSTRFEGVAWDLSKGGMFIACRTVDRSMQRCTVTVLPDDGPPVVVSGVVRHVIASATIQGHPPGLGIRFLAMAPAAREWISSFIDRSA